MKGCRSFSDGEVNLIMGSFWGEYALRDRAIFAVALYTGERIGAVLRLKVGDVLQGGQVTRQITYRRANRKGKVEGRTVTLHPKAMAALSEWINELSQGTCLSANDYIFRSRKGQNRPISRVQYYRILKKVVQENGLTGKIATHSMRKTFADKVYEALGRDLFRTQKALGHKNVNSTVQYLSFKEADIEKAIMTM